MNTTADDWKPPTNDERPPPDDDRGRDERPTGASLMRNELDATELVPLAETSARAIAAQAEARIKARTLVALNRPRDMDTVRVKLLKESQRPGFAAVARYHIPRGKGIEGPTIRFAEAAARFLGNLDVFAEVVFDDREKRILQVTVVDLESNHAESLPVVVEKVMERRKLSKGQEPIGVRTNSSGETVYIVPVDETEMPMRQGASLAKARRNLILAHLPGDILEECQAAVKATVLRQDKQDPDAARKAVADAFAGIGVLPDQLTAYLGVPLASASPEQTVELRAIFAGIRDGQTTWAAIMAERGGGDDAAANGGIVDKLKEKLKANLAAKKGQTAAPAQGTTQGPQGQAEKATPDKAAPEKAAAKGAQPTATGPAPTEQQRVVCDACFRPLDAHQKGCPKGPQGAEAERQPGEDG